MLTLSMEDRQTLEEIAQKLVAPGKGILAADESTGTANKRFAKRGIPEDEEHRRQYRQMLITTPDAEKYLSGVILYDETIRQSADDGRLLRDVLSEKGIIPGIKVDTGTVDLPNFPEEKVTSGLDGLRERLREYADMGAGFTKWRGVIRIDAQASEELPTQACIDANAYVFAQYAGLSQEAGLVPIVEPEVLLDGDHAIDDCARAMERTLTAVFEALKTYRVYMSGVILKSSMVLNGKDSGEQATPEEVANATVGVFTRTVPEDIGGIVFLSGGQTSVQATENLSAIEKISGPWNMTFSFARALQQPAMDAWAGKSENIEGAQEIFRKRLKATASARNGAYDPMLEPEGMK